MGTNTNSTTRTNFLWQQDNHPIELYNAKILHQKLDYIHDNPVVAGIVEKPEDYLYSSARDYCGMPGLIDVLLIELIVSRVPHLCRLALHTRARGGSGTLWNMLIISYFTFLQNTSS